MASKKDIIAVVFLVMVAIPLRFMNLGYSEFQDDEKKAIFRPENGESTFDFFMEQRKGPMQVIVSTIPYVITRNFRNEFAERFPFALINIFSVVTLYLLLYKLSKNRLAALFGSLLYLTNGFIVGFSRIAQYQSLNLFFSFASLYFYSDLVYKDRKLFRSSLLGTLMVCLSALSHWDAVFYIIPTLYFFIVFVLRKDISKEYKLRLFLYNLILGAAILLPFMIPYVYFQLHSASSMAYFQRRVGVSAYNFNQHKYILQLYNPFITVPLFIGLLVTSIFYLKKNYIYVLWFLANLLAIRFYMAKPGTHVYNYVIPAIFLITVTWSLMLSRLSKFTLPIAFLMVLTVGGILYYQSYFLFVDHTVEYPWDSRSLFGRATEPYKNKEVLTFGFPHFRDWKGVNNFVNAQQGGCTFLSNEGKEVSQIYMDVEYGGANPCYYVVTVRKPFISTRDGVIFAETRGKPVLYNYARNGSWMTRVYKIVPKPGKQEKPE